MTSMPPLQGTGRGELASIGTVLQIQNHHRMDDGRMAVENIGALRATNGSTGQHACSIQLRLTRTRAFSGVERFKIVGIVEERPVLVCEVEYLQEEDDEGEEVQSA